ncbi:MAG: malto-oligosyltrehalose synthase, partial [Microcoleus sp.]
ALYGIGNSLSQTLLKIASPGVPDIYQGTEFWDLSHVDPDNRRPVDFDRRIEILQEIKEKSEANILQLIEELIATREDARIKLFLTARLLAARKQYREVFARGNYQPLTVTGTFKDSIIAFARNWGNMTIIAIAPRFVTSVVAPEAMAIGKEIWEDTTLELPPEMPVIWHDAVTNQRLESDGTLEIGEVLKYFPAAMAIGQNSN